MPLPLTPTQKNHACQDLGLFEHLTPPCKLVFPGDEVLVPETPPRQPEAEDAQSGRESPVSYVSETDLEGSPEPKRRRGCVSPSQFASEQPPTGRASSVPPNVKYLE